ncbi:hypothetical protein [uncultured Brevundimonas sp.]|uniref:hypothetical protein n=1 Tax=uncultured Brevundimonas sp. TaxID=213418 RepID=UPI002635D67D|nr:hypothetical protein [uncultured Brevundimonas sp.]
MTDTAKLKDGFYWVRLGDEWVVAEKSSKHGLTQDTCWFLNGFDPALHPNAFDEIDPNPIVREAKQ